MRRRRWRRRRRRKIKRREVEKEKYWVCGRMKNGKEGEGEWEKKELIRRGRR